MKHLVHTSRVLLVLITIIGIAVALSLNHQNLNNNSTNWNTINDILPNSTICGNSLTSHTSKTDQISNLKDFPWTALLKLKLPNGDMIYGCGGTLISEQYVLTAASCIGRREEFMNEVRLGEWDLNTDDDCSTIENSTICADKPLDYQVEEIIYPRSYKRQRAPKHNIALLRLVNKVKFTDYIKPVCLPINDNYRHKNYNGIELNIVGWEIRDRFFINDKQKVYSTVIGSTNQQFEEIANIKLNNQLQMCTSSTNTSLIASSILSGSSLLDYDLINNTTKWTLVGIVSFGTLPEDSNFIETTVYTRVNGYLQWILSKMRQ